ncbi:MAG TPA: thioredoxin family protein [Rhizobiaceae bacterium]|nr:thioredoxin family protein [Rhizobiaceae bacterium]
MAASTPICDFGWKPDDAILPGVDGKTHSILGQAGENGLVVAFICNHCPYVKAVIDRMADDARTLASHGMGFVAICSNDAQAYPADSFDRMREFAAAHALPFHYLHDADQTVARAWDAVCTPDFFGFNRAMELQYRGRLDAARNQPATLGMRRDLVDAMLQVKETGHGPREQVPSIGCSIKWRQAA